ncbi:MAG: glycosyltransferase family 2 protein [Steroidobacteraceae bacterium]|nr:glycosyltransferase family 2 protein [Deltaproteobacteria bacterium]
MDSKPSIAVIISTYNSPEYLRRVLECYLLQSRLPDELIVADDGSTDETARIVANFSKGAPFAVRHIWHEDLGFRLAEIRNRAISAATADYLLFSDGDCIPHPRFVEDHGRMMRKGSFVTGKRMLIGQELSESFSWQGGSSALSHGLKGELSGCHHLLRLPWLVLSRHGSKGLRGCNMAVFRSDLLVVNGFNERITGWGREDSELVTRLFAYGLTRREAPFAAVVLHLWHPENSRSSLTENDRLLEQALASGQYRCPHGIVKSGEINP